jgi:hypothetical protein
MQISRSILAAVAILFVIGVVGQVFLAGLFLFAGGDRGWHINFGYWLELPPLVALLLLWPARTGRRIGWLTLALAVDVFVQTSLPYFKTSVPVVAALHPVNALLVLWLGVTLATATVRLARGTDPVAETGRRAADAASAAKLGS